MRRPDDSETCAKGGHPWIEENIYTHPTSGHRTCKLCKRERNNAPPEDRHPKDSLHCKRGHAWTPENTIKRAKIENGVKRIMRTCRECKRSNNQYYTTGANK